MQLVQSIDFVYAVTTRELRIYGVCFKGLTSPFFPEYTLKVLVVGFPQQLVVLLPNPCHSFCLSLVHARHGFQEVRPL